MPPTDSESAPAPLPGGFTKRAIGYCDPMSVRAGETVTFYLSADVPGAAEVSVVRLISGDDRPQGPGLKIVTEAADIASPVAIPHQPIRTGSYGVSADMPALDEADVHLLFWPTLLVAGERQCLLNLGGLRILLDSNGVCVIDAHGAEVTLSCTPKLRRWHQLTLALSPGGLSLEINRRGQGAGETDAHFALTSPLAFACGKGDWWFACTAPGREHFNGKLEAPRVDTRTGPEQSPETVVAYDFADSIDNDILHDLSGQQRDGRIMQTPTRGVTGASWDGTQQSFKRAPSQYGAIHFHDDDITDAQWQPTTTWRVPADWQSGQYALRIDLIERPGAATAAAIGPEEADDYLPFFVRPAVGRRTSDLAYLVPTASYLAYANQRMNFKGGLVGVKPSTVANENEPKPERVPNVRYANDAYLYVHTELGDSLYEYHRDGSGVHFSSRLRPIMNLRPQNGTWAFNADTHITDWLAAEGRDFDVVTDEDLHLEGTAALTGYRTVITGTHPEYYSTRMRDSLEHWLGDGGRLMYMGGNGFYWRIAHHPENPAIIEVRRAEGGTRAWFAEPGEYHHQFTGEYGGMWRRLGGTPNALVGIGFAAQGFDGGTYYVPQPASLDPRAAFILDGVTDTVLGNFGNQGGGAAGEEIDRWDPGLGSPAHALVIASSENHRRGMLRVVEEFHMMAPTGGEDHVDPDVRADMVFFETPSGGAVFSTGSISYAGSLAHNNYENNISQITRNVLSRFLDATAFEYPSDA